MTNLRKPALCGMVHMLGNLFPLVLCPGLKRRSEDRTAGSWVQYPAAACSRSSVSQTVEGRHKRSLGLGTITHRMHLACPLSGRSDAWCITRRGKAEVMALELRQQLKLQQKLMMTQQLQQAIRLLQLSRQELVESVHQELLENPFLEERETPVLPEERLQHQEEDRPQETSDRVYDEESSRNADWEDYLGDFASAPRDYQQREVQEEENLSPVQRYAEKTTLEGHLLWQLHLSNLTEEETNIGECIIGNLSSSGYLQATVEEIAAMAQVDAEKVPPVLRRIQLFDPVGVAARDVKECLLVQIAERGMDKDPVLIGLVSNHLEDFEAKRFKPMMRHYKLDEEDLKEYMLIIQSLDPMPGASFGSSEPSYISPDVYVRKMGKDFVILLNEDGLPQLTISDSCEQGMQKTSQERSYCTEKKRSAVWLIRSLEQRNRTLYKVVESIVRHQHDFFEQGPQYLKPLILKEIAEDIGMHESTVSRITTNKYVATPHGVFELKYFFNSAVTMTNGSQLGSESVKDMIKKLIHEEQSSNPLSDDAIARVLNRELGVDISRRTVAKYRSMLNIPSSSKRRTLL